MNICIDQSLFSDFNDSHIIYSAMTRVKSFVLTDAYASQLNKSLLSGLKT